MRGSPNQELGRWSDEGPQHTVWLSRSFYIQQTAVSWEQWNEVRDWAIANGYNISSGRKGSHDDGRNTDQDPVTHVNWFDVVKWLNAWSERDGLTPVYTSSGSLEVYRSGKSNQIVYNASANGYRLPTEAEWEYAARAGTTTAFPNGEITQIGSTPLDPNLDRIGWYEGNSNGTTHPVARKDPNAFGLYDMSGNVWEWSWDWFEAYSALPQTDPTGPASGNFRSFRGGSWSNPAESCRSATRGRNSPSYKSSYLGFRPVRS